MNAINIGQEQQRNTSFCTRILSITNDQLFLLPAQLTLSHFVYSSPNALQTSQCISRLTRQILLWYYYEGTKILKTTKFQVDF